MDKQNEKDEKEKKMNPPKNIPNKKNLVVNSVKRHLMMKISIPVFVILIFLSLFVIKSPYTAKERYTDLEPYLTEVTKVVEVPTYYERVCENKSLDVEYTLERTYGRAFGLNGYKCYGEFRAINKGDSDGEWIFRYLFNISGKLVQTDMVTQKIPKYTSFFFKFETEDCQEGDKIDGWKQVVYTPTYEECKNIPRNNRTMLVNDTVNKEVQRERIITKYESLWQKITGYNRYEKI